MEDCHTDSELLTQFHKNTPQLRFSGFNDEWEEKNFSEITYISATKNKSNLPLESYSITNENGFIPQDEQFENGGTMKDADKRMYWIVPPKSFGYNPARINVGSIGYYDGKKDVIVSSLYEIFKMTENCDDAFFWQWFKSEKLQKLVERLQEGGVRLYFYYDKLCMGKIKIPSLSEQQKIGTMLSKIDSLIQAKTKKLESLKAVKKSLLQKCFPKAGEKVPEMRFAGFSGDWEEKEFIELVSRESKTKISDENNPCVEYEDVTPEIGILNNDVYKKKVRKTGISFDNKNILYGKLRPYLHNWLKPNFEGVAVGDWWVLEPNNVDRDFLYRLIQTKKFDDIANQSSGSKMPRADWNLISHSTFSVPMNIEEQQKIGHFFSKYDSLISAQQKEIDKLKDIKKSLLQKMFV